MSVTELVMYSRNHWQEGGLDPVNRAGQQGRVTRLIVKVRGGKRKLIMETLGFLIEIHERCHSM